MHPVTFHLRNKLTWMSRQLRVKNNAADVMDWASAMHSIYNLLVDVSGNKEILQDCSPARNHLNTATQSGAQYQLINRSMKTNIKGQAPEKNTELKTPETQKRRVVQGKRTLLDTNHHTKATQSEPCYQTIKNIDVDDKEDRFAKILPLPSQTATPNTEESIRVRDPSGDGNKNFTRLEAPVIPGRLEDISGRKGMITDYSEQRDLLSRRLDLMKDDSLRNDLRKSLQLSVTSTTGK